MEFKEGIYENLDYPTYDSIPAWRSHDLTSIAKCPFTWKNRTFPKGKHHVELTLCWIWNGQPCKGKLDWHTGTDVWDYKSCRDASPRGFRSAINTFRYHQQAAYYLAGCRAVGLPTEKFYFLAQEKQAPYPFGVYTLSDEAIAYADAQNEQAMAIGIKCREQDLYLPYNQEGIKEFGLADLH